MRRVKKLKLRRRCEIITNSESPALRVTMLRARGIAACRPLLRAYATASGPHSLVFLEHFQGAIDSGSLSAVTAAGQLGGKVTGIVVGEKDHVQSVVEQAKR